jgi:starch phosphorylase
MSKQKQKATVLSRLDALARNLWWTWNPDAQRLFASLDPRIWDATHHNPIKTIKLLTPERRDGLEQDAAFAQHLERVERALADYLKAPTWFARNAKARGNPLVAYFCFEFAIHESLPQYSGGLGVLAGDHVKSASDLGVPLVGIGLLYRRGFYTHQFNPDGTTQVVYPQIDFADCPVSDTGKIIDVPMAGNTVKARIFTQQVGRTKLILLSSDIPENNAKDRRLTDHLYGGDREYRIRQEVLCGVGGMIALDAMGLRPTVYHLNEGHAAFAALERVRRLVSGGKTINQATTSVRKNTVFTTHTPVPAGNERFAPALAWKYLSAAASDLGMSRDELMALGREEPGNKSEEFCMTVLALRLANHCNGVAELHGETSRKMWKKVYNTDDARKVPIGHVTNGVHTRTWLAPDMAELYERRLKVYWNDPTTNGSIWSGVERISPDELWETRRHLRRRMIAFIRRRLADQALRHHASPGELAAIDEIMREDALTIGFARRFATYKRAPLIFTDRKRLARILSDEKRPVQLVFAGKAHPADMGGQKFAQDIYKIAQAEPFKNRVVILEDYDMELGRMLTSGCDVWLNNPLRPQEASGTSGMKPPLHGGINCSILDGWWPEAYNRRNGWEIGEGVELADPKKQDRHDAASIYKLLETQIVPEFYHRDRAGLPRRWIKRMFESMKTVCRQFNTHRMVGEYWTKYYGPAHGASS